MSHLLKAKSKVSKKKKIKFQQLHFPVYQRNGEKIRKKDKKDIAATKY